MKFKIYAAKIEDMNQGWIWLGGHDKLAQRSVVRLSNGDTWKRVYCEVLKIDENFIRDYNRPEKYRIPINDLKSTLVVSEWYRTRLGLERNTEAEIELTSANGFCGRLYACLQHPQVVVRLSTRLGIWSVFLSAIGIILAVATFFVTRK